ncbi:MAG: helix-turn-helix domain-containing protein [bacterium]|nr:helix-turn-helix domain-containing protein [bacterium]
MKTEINKKLGKRIRFLRLQRNLSQEKLAEAIDIATTSLSYIETGRGFMTLSTLEKLAQTLNVELYEIFKFTSLQTNEEIYNDILNKLKIIKNSDEKLKIVYDFIKNIF